MSLCAGLADCRLNGQGFIILTISMRLRDSQTLLILFKVRDCVGGYDTAYHAHSRSTDKAIFRVKCPKGPSKKCTFAS